MKLIAALISLPPLALALSALDTPRAGFLQDILESKAADQKYCKVCPIPLVCPDAPTQIADKLAPTADGLDPGCVLRF